MLQGGDGVRRVLLFYEPMSVTTLSSHRFVCPRGLAGGAYGSCGHNAIVRADGTEETMNGNDFAEVGAGDQVIVELPGGGGYGVP